MDLRGAMARSRFALRILIAITAWGWEWKRAGRELEEGHGIN
jgi:hypothetical protein